MLARFCILSGAINLLRRFLCRFAKLSTSSRLLHLKAHRSPKSLARTGYCLERSAHDISTERESDAASLLAPAEPAEIPSGQRSVAVESYLCKRQIFTRIGTKHLSHPRRLPLVQSRLAMDLSPARWRLERCATSTWTRLR